MNAADDYYHSDDARGVSPGLEKIEVKPYIPPPPPKLADQDPYAARDTLTTKDSRKTTSGRRSHRARKSKHWKNPGESILLYFLDPNQPEVHSGRRCTCLEPCNHNDSPVDSSSPPSDDETTMTATVEHPPQVLQSPHGGHSGRASPRNGFVRKAQDVAQSAKDAVLSPFLRPKREKDSSDSEGEGNRSRRGSRSRTRAKLERKRSSQQQLPTLSTFDQSAKRPRTAENSVYSMMTLGRMTSSSGDVSMGLSPSLRAHMIIDDADDRPDLRLPPLSATSPSDAASPTNGFNLPSVHELDHDGSITRSRASSSVSIMTNGTPRPPLFHRHPTLSAVDSTPTPFTPGPGNTSSHFPDSQRRAPRSQGRPPRLHKYASSNGSMNSCYTSAPSLVNDNAKSPDESTPTDVPTPKTTKVLAEKPGKARTSPITMPANYIHVEHPIPGYKCTHEGCDVDPFPTPYTLSSHAKKHSQDRPYYCPEPGCKRSEEGRDGRGGQGFKRKNEMVRHGLVHRTPGYACPWCTDVTKIYPRPDNLLRHAKDHHKDKDINAPELREILNLRILPTQSRGRKKRTSSDGNGT